MKIQKKTVNLTQYEEKNIINKEVFQAMEGHENTKQNKRGKVNNKG